MDAGAGTQAQAPRRRPGTAPIALALLGAALTGIGAGFGLHFLLARSAPTPSTSLTAYGLYGQATWAAGTQPAPAITALHDQRGRVFALGSLRGRTIAMTFFDSHCSAACPLEGRALAVAERSLPRAERPVLLAVSVNPRDTPASVRAALQKWGLGQVGTWHWLMGSHAQLARVWKAYHIFVAPARGDIIHTEALILIDHRGDERSAYLYPFLPRFVALDLRKLADERTS